MHTFWQIHLKYMVPHGEFSCSEITKFITAHASTACCLQRFISLVTVVSVYFITLVMNHSSDV